MKPAARSILLGLDLDGNQYPSTENMFVTRMGPRSFLDFLENHTGILPVDSSQIERIASFMAVIRENEEAIPSFRASWNNAPLATARELLSWIDTWREHGWIGIPDDRNGQGGEASRIAEVSNLARLAEGRVSSGIGQRVQRVEAALKSGITVPLSKIELLEDVDDWPLSWRRVFELLPCTPTSRWSGLQNPASRESVTSKVRILACDSAVSAARGAAVQIAELRGKSGTAFLIEEAEPVLLDEALAASGLPRTGRFESPSASAAFATLPLALSLRKKDSSLNEILSFLANPFCPLGEVRHFFAKAIADTGGLRNDEWDEAMTKARERWEGRNKDTAALEAHIDFWIPGEASRMEPLPKGTIIDVANRVLDYLASRKDPNCDSAIGGVKLFVRTLELLGSRYDSLPWLLVSDLLASCSPAGTNRGYASEEAGAIHSGTHAGTLTDAVDHLVWFMPQAVPRRDPWPWSGVEREELAAAGCELPDMRRLNGLPLRTLRRAASLARETITLYVNAIRAAGEGLSLAEVYLTTIAANGEGGQVSVEEETLGNKALIPVKAIPLPSIKKWWDLGDSVAPGSGWKTSYSQTTVFIDRPAQWVLEKKAKIYRGSILSLPEKAAIRGTCAHRVTESLFNKYGDGAIALSEKAFDEWFDLEFPRALESYGYTFLEPGNARERKHYERALRSSIKALCRRLAGARAQNIKLERELTSKLFNAVFQGSADLSFDTPGGGCGLVDMKFSSKLSRYAELIREERDIQLTLYAELYRIETGSLPETAYWLYLAETLLARNEIFFPDAMRIDSPNSHIDRLTMIGDAITWRKKQLELGSVEVVCEKSDGIIEAMPPASHTKRPAGAVSAGDIWDRYDPYVALYGWGERA